MVNICSGGAWVVRFRNQEWEYGEWESDLGGMGNVPQVSDSGSVLGQEEGRPGESRPGNKQTNNQQTVNKQSTNGKQKQ